MNILQCRFILCYSFVRICIVCTHIPVIPVFQRVEAAVGCCGGPSLGVLALYETVLIVLSDNHTLYGVQILKVAFWRAQFALVILRLSDLYVANATINLPNFLCGSCYYGHLLLAKFNHCLGSFNAFIIISIELSF